MPIYNLYFMNNRGHIDRIEHVEAVSDEAVIGSAREEEGRQPIEIWSQHRKVYRIEALGDSELRMRRLPTIKETQEHDGPCVVAPRPFAS